MGWPVCSWGRWIGAGPGLLFRRAGVWCGLYEGTVWSLSGGDGWVGCDPVNRGRGRLVGPLGAVEMAWVSCGGGVFGVGGGVGGGFVGFVGVLFSSRRR